MKIVTIGLLLCIPALYGAENKKVKLPPIEEHKKLVFKRALKSRTVDGKTEYLIKPQGQRVAYWLDKETTKQLAGLEQFKTDMRAAVGRGLSYNHYILLEARGLLREQIDLKNKPKKKT